jgi:hypothetical protein
LRRMPWSGRFVKLSAHAEGPTTSRARSGVGKVGDGDSIESLADCP